MALSKELLYAVVRLARFATAPVVYDRIDCTGQMLPSIGVVLFVLVRRWLD
jgi:hypothetical protein